MSVAEIIKTKISERLSPIVLEVADESHLHVGHAGAREGGESHFRIRVVSDRFEGLSRVARQRLINDVLKAELAGPIHALAMQTLQLPGSSDLRHVVTAYRVRSVLTCTVISQLPFEPSPGFCCRRSMKGTNLSNISHC